MINANRLWILSFAWLVYLVADAQQYIYICKDKQYSVYELTDVLDISFATDCDSIVFSEPTGLVESDTVQVRYTGTSAEVFIPYKFSKDVTVSTNGGHVAIHNMNTSDELVFSLTGTTDDGSLTYNGTYKTTIVLNGVNITNPSGAALNIQDGKRIALELTEGTGNTLTDGAGGTHKATLYCKGHLEISGGGGLTVNGNTNHAIASKEYLQLKKSMGSLTIARAANDGIHAGQYFQMNGGVVTVNDVAGDAIQAEATGDEGDEQDGQLIIKGGTLNLTVSADGADGLKADSLITIADGDITITASGADAKGINAGGDLVVEAGSITIKNGGTTSKSIKSKETVTLNGGTVTLTPSGGMQVVSNDASYCSGIKAEDFVQNGGTLTITASGTANRGISATNITTNGGTLQITNSSGGQTGTNDTYTAKGLKADKKIALNAGDITIRMSGNGGKGILSDGTYTQGTTDGAGPTLSVTTTGSAYGSNTGNNGGGGGGGPFGGRPGGGGPNNNSSGSSAKAIKVQGNIYLYGGETTVGTSTDGAEGLESKSAIYIEGGKHYFKCYDDCINASGCIYFNGGVTVCYSNGNDAVDSNAGKTGAITIGNGVIFAYSTKGSPEEGLDCDDNRYIQITGTGIAISAGGTQGGGMGGSSSNTITNAQQGYYFHTGSVNYATGRYYTLADTSGNNLVTFSFEASCNSTLSLITATGMKSGNSYNIKYSTIEPSDATTVWHGLYLGCSHVGTTSAINNFTAK